jgi:dephospho-CoA kinase
MGQLGSLARVKVGLTGGLGSGKSTAAELLAARGAVVVDADAVAREVVQAGTPGFDAVVTRFGQDVVGSDGELDRAALARLVFTDPEALADLNAIVHPLVAARSDELAAAAPVGAVVVHDIPLLAENGLADRFDLVVVVQADRGTRLTRLAARGLSPAEAESRMAAQATDEQRRAVADEVLHNDGDRAALARAVDRLWARLTSPTGRRG